MTDITTARVCKRCGKTVEIDPPSEAAWLRKVADSPHGFTVRSTLESSDYATLPKGQAPEGSESGERMLNGIGFSRSFVIPLLFRELQGAEHVDRLQPPVDQHAESAEHLDGRQFADTFGDVEIRQIVEDHHGQQLSREN